MRITGLPCCCVAPAPHCLRVKCQVIVACLSWALVSLCLFYVIAARAILPEFDYYGIKIVSLSAVIVLLLSPFFALVVAIRSLQQLLDIAKLHNGEICELCTFPIPVQGDSDTISPPTTSQVNMPSKCPECGTTFSRQSGARWRNALKILGLDTSNAKQPAK